MPRVRDLLYRFRPAGGPGAATPAGVPVDRVAAAAAELAPLFARLADVEDARARLSSDALRDAENIRAEGGRQAQAVEAAARHRCEVERASAATRAREQAAAETRAALDRAAQHAAHIRELADVRMPGQVDHVVSIVREGLGQAP